MFENFLKRLKPAIFNYKDAGINLDTEKTYIGVMAQDIIKAIELEGLNYEDFSIVKLENSGFYSVDYIQLIPILISKINSLEEKINKLERA